MLASSIQSIILKFLPLSEIDSEVFRLKPRIIENRVGCDPYDPIILEERYSLAYEIYYILHRLVNDDDGSTSGESTSGESTSDESPTDDYNYAD